MRTKRMLSGMLLLLLAGAGLLFGQGTDLGIIRGTITDSQGAVVAGAKVVITDVATGIAIERTSDAAGNYEAVNLKSGTYKVTVSMAGFNNAEIRDVTLTTGATARADAKLTVKSMAEAVTITSEAPLIQMETPVVSGTLNSQQLLELPRDSRDIYDFLYLNPNITYNPDDGFKFVGGPSYGANFVMDGQRATGAGFGQNVGGTPSVEVVGEIDVLSNSFSAEYGGIANIRVSTRRGTSQYHGSLFYDNRNAALAAWPYQSKIDQAQFYPSFAQPTYPKPQFNFTETGGSFGGPVPGLSKKTFFMFAFEHRWDDAPVRFTSTRLPHATVMGGDFSLIKDANKPSVPTGTALTADEIATNTVGGLGKQFVKIPQRLLNPYVTKLVSTYFPQTSALAPINNTRGYLMDWAMTQQGLITRPLYNGRVDHDFSDRDKIYGVINAQTVSGSRTALASPFMSLGTQWAERQNETLSLSWNHTFTPTLINEARGGLNYFKNYRRANLKVKDFLSSIGFSDADVQAWASVVNPTNGPEMWGTFPINVGGFPAFGNMGRNADRGANQNMWNFGDTITWIKGKHSLRAGFDLVHNYVLDAFTVGRGAPRGAITYDATLSGWAKFLMGLPANNVNHNIATRGAMEVNNWEHGYFIQDDFKVTPRLTLNLGLRYELITPFIETNDLLVNFDFNYTDPKTGNKGRFIVPSEKTVPFLDPRMVTYGYATANQVGVGRGLVNADGNNFAPRVGAAFRLTDKMVLRGGYGLFYPTAAAQGIRDSLATNPFNQSVRFTNRTTAPLMSWPRPFTGGAPNITATSQPSVNSIPFDVQQPRIQQFNITFERETKFKTAVRASYLGTRVWGLSGGIDRNSLAPSNVPFGTTIGDGKTPCDLTGNNFGVDPDVTDYSCNMSPADFARLPFPGLGDWLMANGGNFGSLRSDAFQLEANRKLSNGLMFSANYTLLRQINSVIDADSSLGDPVYNPQKPLADTGKDAFVSRHRFVAFGTYDLPVGQGRRFGSSMNRVLDAVVGGWQTSFQTFIKSGTAFTPWWTCDNCGDYAIYPGNTFSSTITAGQFTDSPSWRPLVTGDPNKKSGSYIWNASAYNVPSVGADLYDNPNAAKRNSLNGPRVWNANIAVSKSFRINERMRLTFRGVFDNVFNHPTFAPTNDASIAWLGSFMIETDPKTGNIIPIGSGDPAKGFLGADAISRNPDFGRLQTTYMHEGIADRRLIRLSLRLTF